MSLPPYPNFPPNFKEARFHKGLVRECLIIEFRSSTPLNRVHVRLMKEKLEAVLDNYIKTIPNLEEVELVDQERFDIMLSEGLRLPRSKK